MKLITVCIVIVLSGTRSFSQLAPTVGEICHVVHPRGWVKFPPHNQLPATDVFPTLGGFFGLGTRDEMVLTRSDTSRPGVVRYRFKQYHNGIPIRGAVFLLHEYDGKVTKGNGIIVPYLNRTSNAIISKQEAFERSIQALGSKKLAIHDKMTLNVMSRKAGFDRGVLFPKTELVYEFDHPTTDLSARYLRLVYRMEVMTVEPWREFTISVDARTGEVCKVQGSATGCTTANGNTLYNGAQDVGVSHNGTHYYLKDVCDDVPVVTQEADMDISDDNVTISHVTHGDLDWKDDSTLDPYIQAQYSTMKTLEFFAEPDYDHQGYDNSTSEMLLVIGGTTNPNWYPILECVGLPEYMTSTQAWLTNWPTAVDVVAHEWTHAITKHFEPELLEAGETGGLYESFGDIFGSMVECYAVNCTAWTDFVLGSDCLQPALQRDMKNPHSKSDPHTYCGQYFTEPSTGHHYDLHTTGGVQNKWFTILVEGTNGAFANDHCCSTSTSTIANGIGKDKASLVAWRNLRDYFTPYYNYVDARLGSIEAAADLVFDGDITSSDEAVVPLAWDAVGVYSAPMAWIQYRRCETYTSASYETEVNAAHKIWVAGNSTCTLSVESGATLDCTAGKSIRIRPNFRAKTGCEFRASLDGQCDIILPLPFIDELDTRGHVATTGKRIAPESLTVLVNPNPASWQTELWVQSVKGSAIDISLVDGYGRVVARMKRTIASSSGAEQIEMDLSQHPSGLYICTVSTNDALASSILQILR